MLIDTSTSKMYIISMCNCKHLDADADLDSDEFRHSKMSRYL